MKRKLSDVDVMMEWVSAVDAHEEYTKDLNKYGETMTEDEKAIYAQRIADTKARCDKYHAELKERDLHTNRAMATKCWRKYGGWKRLYWKSSNPNWQWDSDVIAKTSGSLFTSYWGVLSMCAHSYQLKKPTDNK